jgi:microcystin-dependent protein
MFGGPSIPTGWLVCDGTAVSRTTYAALYAAIGTYWGAGDNISTFNLPDLRGRSALGYVNSPISGITSRGFASKGGEENHVLSTAELAAHAHGVTDNGHGHPGSSDTGHGHTLNDPGHTHGGVVVTVVGSLTGTGANIAANYGQTASSTTHATIATGYANLAIANAATGIAIQNNGSNNGHNNMSPFAVLYFIIKT